MKECKNCEKLESLLKKGSKNIQILQGYLKENEIEIKHLNSLNRVRSEKRKKKIVDFLKREGKATLSELADHCGIKSGNCSRNCTILIKEGKIKKIRRGLFKLR